MDRFMSSNDQAGSSEKSEPKCCYICLENSQDQLIWIGHKLREQLTECNIRFLQNDATPKYLCHSCRTDIKDSCELLSRVRIAREFWTKYSEKLGVPVRKSKPSPATEEKVLLENKEKLTDEKKRKKLPNQKNKQSKNFYRCHLCLEKFAFQVGFKNHMWLVHFKNKDRPECCVVCGVKCQSSEKCRTHYFRYHFNNHLVCDMCGKSGMTDTQFKFHLKAIHGTNPKKIGVSVTDFLQIDLITNVKQENEHSQNIEVVGHFAGKQENENSWDNEVDDHYADTDFDPPSPSESCATMNGFESVIEDQPQPAEKRKPTETTQSRYNETSARKKRKLPEDHPSPLITLKEFDSFLDKKCLDCDRQFAESEYYQHVWDTHARMDDNPQICRKCGEEFPTEDLCCRHYFAKHVDQTVTCSICFKTNLSKHVAFHIIYCYKKYQTLLSSDEQAKTNCSHCKEEFPQNDKVKLFRHIWTNHILNPDSPTVCSVCQKECFTQDNNQAHYFFIHFDTSHKCISCSAEGFNRIQLSQHRLEVHSIDRTKNYKQNKNTSKQMDKCEFCGDESFPIASNELYLHVWKTHVRKSEAPDRCDECKRNYAGEFYAMMHYINHHYRKNKICDECGKGNFTQKQLLYHKKNHELDRSKQKIKCTMCTRTLNSQETYQKHLEFHAKQGPKSAQCNICGVGFSSSTTLKEHTRRVHLKAANYNCRFCSKGFFSKNGLVVHEIAMHTKLYPFKCSACGVETAQLENMRLHVRRRHLNNLKATPDEIDIKYVIRQNGAENFKVHKNKVKKMLEGQDEQNSRD